MSNAMDVHTWKHGNINKSEKKDKCKICGCVRTAHYYKLSNGKWTSSMSWMRDNVLYEKKTIMC